MTVDLRQHSVAVILAGQAATGAYLASPNFTSYRYSWPRDGSFIAHGMDRANQHESALAFHRWVDQTLQRHREKVFRLEEKLNRGEPIGATEWLRCRYTPEGAEDDEPWAHFQLDGYGTWLWSLTEHARLSRNPRVLEELRASVDLVVRYLTRVWDRPNADCWEEHDQEVHASTLACIYGGLAAIARTREGEEAAALLATCGQIKQIALGRFVHHGRLTKFADGRSVDANLLWVAIPFGLLPPDHPIMRATVAEIEGRCFTGGVHRYPEDTYYGGGEWVILTAWLGWYYVTLGEMERARTLLDWVTAQADAKGDLPEQVTLRVNRRDMLRPWIERWGPVARPLLWSHAMYLVLDAELAEAGDQAVRAP